MKQARWNKRFQCILIHNDHQFNGIAVALAWPQTLCKQAGAWYDSLMSFAGFNRKHYYQIGHAAVLLVDQWGRCHYFDFGRYHAPFGYGRVRSAHTDHELKVNIKALLSDGFRQIENIEDILSALKQNPSCHGDGPIYAAYCPINFDRAFEKAIELQNNSPLAYGPFIQRGTNCSRFVRTVILAGRPPILQSLRLRFLMPLTPVPMGNVNNLGRVAKLKSALNDEHKQEPLAIRPGFTNAQELFQCLPAPECSPPEANGLSYWLGGEGAGSWFCIRHIGSNALQIIRMGPNGTMECTGFFHGDSNISFQLNQPFEIRHISHCQQVSIFQNEHLFKFYRQKKSSVAVRF